MDVTAAIFDFDGTLVDSCAMWLHVYQTLLADHGVTWTPRIDELGRPMNLDAKCAWYHAEFGMGESGEELYDELLRLARAGYAAEVSPLPGAVGFLKALAAEGVKLAVASSTPEAVVRPALRSYGIEGLFSAVVCTADVGRGKDFPDVYLATADRLGEPPGTSWVFEDAPFALRSAKEGGFHTVAILGEWDALDPVLQESSDIVVHGYAELTPALLCDFADVPTRECGTMRALVVDGSPEPSSAQLVAGLAGEADYVIAVDRGAETLLLAGVGPDVFCGDADSVSEGTREWAHALAATDIRYPPAKYATDLSLALDCAIHEAARRESALELVLTCASGGRVDHMLAVIGLLAAHAAASPRIVEDSYECRILAPEGTPCWRMGEGHVGATFSCIALRDGTVVSERGTRWELDHAPLELLGDLGISNVVASADAAVICHGGIAAVIVQREGGARAAAPGVPRPAAPAPSASKKGPEGP